MEKQVEDTLKKNAMTNVKSEKFHKAKGLISVTQILSNILNNVMYNLELNTSWNKQHTDDNLGTTRLT